MKMVRSRKSSTKKTGIDLDFRNVKDDFIGPGELKNRKIDKNQGVPRKIRLPPSGSKFEDTHSNFNLSQSQIDLELQRMDSIDEEIYAQNGDVETGRGIE
jgi:hypothetical protein